MTPILKQFGIFFSALALSATAAMADDDKANEPLELYPHDASDPCVPGALQVRVNVVGVTAMGIMKIELYNSDKNFLDKKGRIRIIRVPAEDGPQLICVDVPETGQYAVAGYHDRDGNRKLKKKWDFTPREPIGISNNLEIKSRKMPKFEDAAFNVGPDGQDIDFILVDLKALKKQRKSKK